MLKFPLCFGAVRHCKLIGEADEHKALRHRNEQRLAALKKSNRLYEDKRESTSARNQPAASFDPIGNYPYVPGAAFDAILGYPTFGFGGPSF